MKTTLLSLFAALALAACGGGNNSSPDAHQIHEIDANIVDAGPQPDASCYTNPVTHHQIINACTTAEQIHKTPVLPNRLADGGLPPLP
jgi:hypothetical protein